MDWKGKEDKNIYTHRGWWDILQVWQMGTSQITPICKKTKARSEAKHINQGWNLKRWEKRLLETSKTWAVTPEVGLEDQQTGEGRGLSQRLELHQGPGLLLLRQSPRLQLKTCPRPPSESSRPEQPGLWCGRDDDGMGRLKSWSECSEAHQYIYNRTAGKVQTSPSFMDFKKSLISELPKTSVIWCNIVRRQNFINPTAAKFTCSRS